MTDFAQCIRGCATRQGVDDDGQERPPLPRRASVGFLCRQCAERLTEALHDIPDLWAEMPRIDESTAGDDSERVSRGKISGSPSLIRLDVMVLLGWGQAADGVMPVWETLAGWLRLYREELNPADPTEFTVSAMCDLFTRQLKRICAQPWVDEFWKDTVGIRAALRRATGAPAPIGRCFGHVANKPCGRLLYLPKVLDPRKDDIEIVCPDPNCARTYRGVDILKLQIQAEREAAS